MREFITNKSKEPTEVNLFDQKILVDLKSTDCVQEYTTFILKKSWKQQFGDTCKCEVSVNRRNGNIRISDDYDNIQFWSMDTVANIKNFVNAVIDDRKIKQNKKDNEQREKEKFIEGVRKQYPELKFDDAEVSSYGTVSIDTNINGLGVMIDSDYEIEYYLPNNKENMHKVIKFLLQNQFDLNEVDEDDD